MSEQDSLYTREHVGTFRVRIEAGMYSAAELRALAVLADEQREKVRESLQNSLVESPDSEQQQ